jgi:hypothetical protein
MKHALLVAIAAGAMLQSPLSAQAPQPFVRDPKIAVDAEYTKKIKEYTTEPFFTSPLVDYLPAFEKGHVVAFSNNPIWRGETEGSYFLVFNTLLNYDALDAGRKLDAR